MYRSAWTMRGRRRGFSPGAFAYADFGPWGRKRRFFESGQVRLALLSLLAERDQLRIPSQTGHRFRLKLGSGSEPIWAPIPS